MGTAQQEFTAQLIDYAKTPSLRVAGSLQLCKVTPSSEWHGLRTNHYGMAVVSHAIDKTILIRYLHSLSYLTFKLCSNVCFDMVC